MWPRKLPLDNVDFFPRRLIENRLYLFTINMLYDVRTLYYVRENHRVSNDRQQTAKTSITTTKTHTITQYRCVNVEKLIWIEVRICFGREGKLKIDPEAAKKKPEEWIQACNELLWQKCSMSIESSRVLFSNSYCLWSEAVYINWRHIEIEYVLVFAYHIFSIWSITHAKCTPALRVIPNCFIIKTWKNLFHRALTIFLWSN